MRHSILLYYILLKEKKPENRMQLGVSVRLNTIIYYIYKEEDEEEEEKKRKSY